MRLLWTFRTRTEQNCIGDNPVGIQNSGYSTEIGLLRGNWRHLSDFSESEPIYAKYQTSEP